MQKVVGAFEHSDAVKVRFYLQQVDHELKPLGYCCLGIPYASMDPRKQIAAYGYYVSPPASSNAFRKSFFDEIMPIVDAELYRQVRRRLSDRYRGHGGGNCVDRREPGPVSRSQQ